MKTCPRKWGASFAPRVSMLSPSATSGCSALLIATTLREPLRCLECSAPTTVTFYDWPRKESSTPVSCSRHGTARASAVGFESCKPFTRDSLRTRLETWCSSFQPERLRTCGPGASNARHTALAALVVRCRTLNAGRQIAFEVNDAVLHAAPDLDEGRPTAGDAPVL